MLKILKASYLEDYKIEVLFNNSVEKIIDLKDKLEGEIFLPLRNKEFFKDFKINFNTFEWKNGADFAPEYLFEIGVPSEEYISN